MRVFISVFLLFSVLIVSAQEVNCRVSVVGDEFQGVDKEIFQSMRTSIQEFVNGRVWTNNVFEEHERIDVNFKVQITGLLGSDNFQATLQVQANRPVYNSTYPSLMFNFLDENFSFEYTDHGTLEYEDNSFTSNLTSVLAFYVYFIIGLDYDSFALNGGTEFYQKAESVVNAAQSSDYAGWKSFEKNKKNRYWMAENALSPTFSDFRKAVYTYHRLGLDVFADKPEDARAKITESLFLLEKVNKQKPGALVLQLFFYGKSKELINIYSGAPANEQTRVIPLLKTLDISNASKYDEIEKK